MLRRTHKIIAEKIADNLGFSIRNSAIFVDGTLGPDTHGDFPHKTGKNSKILHKIDEARRLSFLNDEYAYGELGNALHYIQDKWVDDVNIANETNLTTDDRAFTEKIKQAQMPENLKKEYLNIANTLLRISNNGIDEWFNHQWGIWHIDYASCVFVFADIVELMLPTLQPDITVTSDKTKLEEYVHSEAFKQATKQSFFASLITNYLDPKIQGYTAAIFTLSLIGPPTNQQNSEIHFQIVYRLSQEIARYTIAKPEQFKYQDNWTHKTSTQKVKLSLLKPQYLTLIKQPISEVHKKRIANFFDEKQNFLQEWPSIQKAMPTIQRTETWKIILSGLMEQLKTEGK
jgi:hypothetical protein